MKGHLVWSFGCAVVAALAATPGCASDTGSPAGDEPNALGETESLAARIPRSPQGIVAPNRFELSGGDLHITYEIDPMDRLLLYEDGKQRLVFHRGDIQVAETQIGTLASVVLHRTIDAGSTTFTLLIPGVTVVSGTATPVETQGITTFHGRVPPIPAAQQLESYVFTPLTGTAADHRMMIPAPKIELFEPTRGPPEVPAPLSER